MNYHQTEAHARFLASISWNVERYRQGNRSVVVYIRPLPVVRVSVMKIQRLKVEQLDWERIAVIEKKYHTFETMIELDYLTPTLPPVYPELLAHGFTPSRDYMCTTKTRILTIDQPEAALLAAMKPKTRYNIHLAERNGLQTKIWSGDEVGNDTQLFEKYYKILQANAHRIGMWLIPKSWLLKQLIGYGKNGLVIGIVQPGSAELLTVATFLLSKDTVSYSHNGSTALGRKLMAPTLAIWEGIKAGKKRHLLYFDFDGVDDERYRMQKRFKGFTRFKAGFGGEELYFPPMYHKYRWPF